MNRKSFVFIIFCLFISNLSAIAQSAVFNVPSTEVAPKKSVYSEVNFSAHFDKPEKGGFQAYGYKMVYGIKENVEVGMNFYYTRSSLFSLKELQANAKWKFYKNEKKGIAVVSGVQVCLPLKNTLGLKPSAMFYSNVSKSFAKSKGTKFTGGYYRMVGAKSNIVNKNGMIAGVEQPLSARMAFVADWYSGKNRFGYSSAGLRYYLTNKQVLYAGYNFGNIGRSNNSFFVSYGIHY